MSSLSKPSTWNGKKIKQLKDNCILGGTKAKEIIAGLNSLLFWKVNVVDGQTGRVVIDDRGTVLEIPRDGVRATTSGPSGATRYRVKNVYGTYLVCRSWDGTTEGTADVNVAKPPHLRWYASAWPGMTVVGAALTFVWSALTDNVDGQRTVSDGTNPDQTEIVVPVWQVAANGAGLSGGYDEIWADTPVGGTGVTVSGTVVTLMDDNRNGRRWCLLNTQPT